MLSWRSWRLGVRAVIPRSWGSWGSGCHPDSLESWGSGCHSEFLEVLGFGPSSRCHGILGVRLPSGGRGGGAEGAEGVPAAAVPTANSQTNSQKDIPNIPTLKATLGRTMIDPLFALSAADPYGRSEPAGAAGAAAGAEDFIDHSLTQYRTTGTGAACSRSCASGSSIVTRFSARKNTPP